MQVQRKSLNCKVLRANCPFKGKQITLFRLKAKKIKIKKIKKNKFQAVTKISLWQKSDVKSDAR